MGGTHNSAPENPSLTLRANYDFFCKKLQNTDVNVVFRGVSRLAIVDVRLDLGTDDPQQIFESLNSTGVHLDQADLVRNYILMGLGEDQQTRLYNTYWREIERRYTTGVRQMDNFLREFVALRTGAQKQGRSDRIYSAFRSKLLRQNQTIEDREDLLEDMTRFARYHAAFTLGTGEFERVALPLAELRAVATTPAILVMRLLSAYEKEELSAEELEEALRLIESYVVRRDVCDLPANSYWKQFARLAHQLKEVNLLKELKVRLHWLREGNYGFPTDEEFSEALQRTRLYGRAVCRTILEGLEHRVNSKERTDTGLCTIEHIMPQNEELSEGWRLMLGNDWKEVHGTWLHRLGNLTLTGYNPEYSDRTFEEKRTMEHGFEQSPLRLNQSVGRSEQWTAAEMERRGKELAEQALHVWPSLVVRREWEEQVRVEQFQEEGGDREAARGEMDEVARELFDGLRELINPVREEIIEVATERSVSYYFHNAELFCELLPRTNHLLLLLELAPDQCGQFGLEARDAGEWSFIKNARNDAASVVAVYTTEHVVACGELLRHVQVTGIGRG